jgi:hypothetical protein
MTLFGRKYIEEEDVGSKTIYEASTFDKVKGRGVRL